MRTTITIEDGLLEELKRRAAETGSTVSRLIEDSVRQALHAQRQTRDDRPAFELVTFGAGGRFTRLNVDKVSSIDEAEDLEKYGEQVGTTP